MEFWFSEYHTPDVKLSASGSTGSSTPSRAITSALIFLRRPEFGRVLTLDGNVMLTERDEFIYHEMIAHVPMAVHPKWLRTSWSSAPATAAWCGS